MPKSVLILHGIEGHAGIHWQKWLKDQLTALGYVVFSPNLPEADHPNRKEWQCAVEEQAGKVKSEDLIIVGHSLGVVSALDYIEALPRGRKLAALVAVSGFAQDHGVELNSYFLKEKAIDFEAVRSRLEKAVVIYGDDDPYVPQEVLLSLAKNLNVSPVVVPKGGHLNTASGYTTFPQLLRIIQDLHSHSDPA